MPERRALAAALLTAAAVGVPGATAEAADARVDFRFEDARISESSGLALSVRHPHTVWTVNDSGDLARVFAVDTRTGTTVGVHTFTAKVRDVEALAITPQGRMLVADIGDNGASRDVVSIYWFDEPALGTTTEPGGRTASWELAYPDGPHDAEAVAVDPRSGRILVVTKDRVGGIYALPTSPSRRGVNRLTRVGTAPPTVTDAVFVPDRSALALRGYTSLDQVDPDTFAGLLRTPLPLQPQGETIAVAPGGRALLIGSEGRRSRVQEVKLPALPKAPDDPSSAPTPSTSSPIAPSGGSPTPAASPSTSETAEEGARPRVDRGELWAGLGALLGLVLLAAVVVRLAGRRPR